MFERVCFMLKRSTLFIPLIISVTLTTILASLASSFRTISMLSEIGAPISLAESLKTALYDLQHFAPLYGLFILIAFTIAFLVTQFTFKRFHHKPKLIYGVAAMSAIWVMLWAMKQVFFGVPIVAGARDGLGLSLQLIAGALGGIVFIILKTRLKKEADS